MLDWKFKTKITITLKSTTWNSKMKKLQCINLFIYIYIFCGGVASCVSW